MDGLSFNVHLFVFNCKVLRFVQGIRSAFYIKFD